MAVRCPWIPGGQMIKHQQPYNKILIYKITAAAPSSNSPILTSSIFFFLFNVIFKSWSHIFNRHNSSINFLLILFSFSYPTVHHFRLAIQFIWSVFFFVYCSIIWWFMIATVKCSIRIWKINGQTDRVWERERNHWNRKEKQAKNGEKSNY